MKAATLTAKPANAVTNAVNCQLLLECCGWDRRLAAAIIVTRPDDEQKQLLATIQVVHQRRNVSTALWQIKEALGMAADHE
jgi:hypothetical protein